MDTARTFANHAPNQAVAPRGELAARQLAMPSDTNPAGDVFVGWVMASMDAAAVMTTTRLAEAPAVTVAVANMVFLQSVRVAVTSASTPM